MKVAELIRLLSTARPDSEVELEGCDCTGACIGATEIENPVGVSGQGSGSTIYLRVKDGVLGWDKPPPAIHRNSVRQSNDLG